MRRIGRFNRLLLAALLLTSPPAVQGQVDSQWNHVTGAVVKPGTYNGIGRTIVEVIDLAGGLDVDADAENIVIMHRSGAFDVFSYSTIGQRPRRPLPIVRAGDAVLVPKLGAPR